MEGTNLPGLKPEDYHLGAGEKLNEAISRSWTRLLSLWAGFRKAKAALPASDLGTTLTRERWLLQLFQELGYGRLLGASPFVIDEKTYPISHLWQGQYYKVPIHLVSFRADLDKRSEQRIQGASKASPHGMVQEFLNRSEHHLWAFVSNGLKLVILRDNASLTRQAYVEFDLEGIFDGEAFADFRLLWMVCHQSRLEGTAKDRPETCWLELWSKQAQTDGRRALDQLRVGVEKALESLGTGFVSHKANQALCQRLKAGELNKQDFYRQLLRLIYRLIFLFVAEDRDLLHFPGASDEARSRYVRFYSGQRLRRMAERTRGSRHADLWAALRLVFAKLGNDRGCPELGLPALGGFLFGPQAIPDLESAELANEHLLQAIRNLGLVKDRSGWRLVDYRNLGSEELGSVYESLLELNPTMELDAGVFSLSTVAGNQRKTSGSYYTPDSLVQCLLDSALDPVVEQAIKGKAPAEAEKAILALKVCDPAVGSGHFLVGAAHRLAMHLAQVRAQAQGDSEPSPLYYQHALRDVIGHCLYGVDVNPMAAELCRVSLWLEAIEPGKPLSFLDHHIRVGNSLLGATPALLAKGIPDEAFTPIEGDDKEICSRFKKLNKDEKKGFQRLFAATTEPWERLGDLAASMMHLDDAPDDSIEAVRVKERMYEAMVRSGNYLDGQFWADAWCAAFVWKKTREFQYPITEEVFRRIEHNPHTCDVWMQNEIVRLSNQYQFFHWHVAFPDVFHVPPPDKKSDNELAGWNGGFDVVLGNPPWEKVKLQEREFFASLDPLIATAKTAAIRKKLIAKHREADSHEWRLYIAQLEVDAKLSGFYRLCKRFPLTAAGEANTYSLFAELATQVTSSSGVAGQILKTGIVNAVENVDFYRKMVLDCRLWQVRDFKNWLGWFPDVGYHERFSLVTISGTARKVVCTYAFNCLDIEEATSAEKIYELTGSEVELLNPNIQVCPVFSNRNDMDITCSFYRRFPPLVRETTKETPWGTEYQRMFDMTSDSSGFHTLEELSTDGYVLDESRFFRADEEVYVPLLEGKHIHGFTHRFATYEGIPESNRFGIKAATAAPLGDQLANPAYEPLPRYWVNQVAWRKQCAATTISCGWCIAFRDVTNLISNARTTMATVAPPRAFGNSAALIYIDNDMAALHALFLVALMNSVPFDFAARQKLFGAHLNKYILWQLPAPRPLGFFDATGRLTKLGSFIYPRSLELCYTTNSLNAFAIQSGCALPPFRWDDDRRFVLRCELDAAFFHLYLPAEPNGDWSPAENEKAEDRARLKASFPTPRAAVAYIMDTFPIVKRKDEEKWGEYRTKRVILEIYDAMAEAARTSIPYQTRLSPPPADAAVAHPWPEEIIQVAAVSKDAFTDIAALPDEVWATPVGVTPDNVALFSLIDVLQAIGEAADPEKVRLAAILVRKPVLAAAFMDDAQAAQWLRLIGQDARLVRGNVVQISQFQKNGVDYPWAEAIRRLRGSGALVVGSDGKWSAGDRMPASSSQDWITGRAAIAVQLLSAIDPARVEQRLIAFNRSVEDGTARRAVS
ncbi:MAG: N-6 DNA methylase [Terracidiphilus sp.]